MPTAPRPRSGWRLAPGQRAQRSLRWLPRRIERPGLEKARDRGAHEDATTRAHCSVAAQRSAPLSIHTEIQLDAAFPMRPSPPLSLNHVLPFSLGPVCPLLQPWIAAVYGCLRQKFTSRMTVRLRAGTRKCGPAQPCSHSARCHGHHGGGRKVHCASSWLTTWQSTCCVTSKRSSLLASRAAARKCEGLRRRAATSPW